MNGVILINKPKDWTSRDVINKLNKLLNTKKIGHTGTLDPIATGILVVLIGKYTKCTELLSSLTKEYIAEIKLGIKTDTLDITGNVLEEKTCHISKEDIINEFKSLKGTFKQKIPMYAAKKIDGKKLYDYARSGIEIPRPENEVEIYNIELLDFNNDIVTFKTTVSKGTYIRSLIEKICDDLNILGTMSNLIRTKQGDFTIEDSFSLDDIEKGNYRLLKVHDLFDYPTVELNKDKYKLAKNGNKISLDRNEDYLILNYQNEEVAIYKRKDDYYQPEIMF